MSIENLDINPLGLANRVREACVKREIFDVTNMKLQKLCYYTYANFYDRNNVILFQCDKIKFWKFGPVIEPIYEALRQYKLSLIHI